MPDLFTTYPELSDKITSLCDGRPWNVLGVSALVSDHDALYFEITPPRPARNGPAGDVLCGIGGIGGKIAIGETVLSCLHREAAEEMQARITVHTAPSTHLLFEQRLEDTLRVERRDHPLPAFCTISRYRAGGRVYPDRFAVIVTFSATLVDAPERDDLFGLLRVPRAALSQVFEAPEIPLARLERIEGVSMETREPVPANAVFFTTWTARSFQLLLHAALIDGAPHA